MQLYDEMVQHPASCYTQPHDSSRNIKLKDEADDICDEDCEPGQHEKANFVLLEKG